MSKDRSIGRLVRYSRVFLTFALVVLTSSSCDLLGIKDSAEKAVDILDRAIDTLESESADWQSVLEETRDQMVDAAQSTIAHEVGIVLDRALAASGAEFRCDVDFIRARVRQELIRIRAELLKQSPPAKEPKLCHVVPEAVDASKVPGRLPWLSFWGYDFDIAQKVQVILVNDGEQLDVSQHLDIPTHYQMTLNLGANGVQLSPNSKRFVLKWSNQEISSITISQPPDPEPELPACFWTAHVSEETPSRECNSGYALKGIKCRGRYCDNKELYCCPYMPDGDPNDQRRWSTVWISEEGPSSFSSSTGFVAGLWCKHDYCDNMRIQHITSPHLRNAGHCSFRPYFSEEGAAKYVCEENYFVAGIACKGDYCDNISLMCCRYE